MIHSIYGLVCPIKKQIVYVGSSVEVPKRLRAHLAPSNRTYGFRDWLTELRRLELIDKVSVVILQEVKNSFSKASDAEKKWITRLSKTHSLINRMGNPNIKKASAPTISIAEYNGLSDNKIETRTKQAAA